MGGERKVRSDRKRDIKPTVNVRLKDAIFRIAYITNTPAKDVAEQICLNGIQEKRVLSHLAKNFKRTIQIDNTVYMGDVDRAGIRKKIPGNNERISIRFKKEAHENIATLAYALDCSVSRACAELLEVGIRDFDFIDNFVRTYIEKNVDAERLEELEEVFRYLNNSEEEHLNFSWALLLSYILDEVKGNALKIQEAVSDFLVNHWNEK